MLARLVVYLSAVVLGFACLIERPPQLAISDRQDPPARGMEQRSEVTRGW